MKKFYLRPGWPMLLLIAALMLTGRWCIKAEHGEQERDKTQVLTATQDLSVFSIINTGDFNIAKISPPPADGIQYPPKGRRLVTIAPLRAGEALRRTHVVAFPEKSDLVLLSTSVANAVVARPGDEILLMGVSKREMESKELGSAVYLGERNGQIVVALCQEDASRVAPFSAGERRVVAVRRLADSRLQSVQPSSRIQSAQVQQLSLQCGKSVP